MSKQHISLSVISTATALTEPDLGCGHAESDVPCICSINARQETLKTLEGSRETKPALTEELRAKITEAFQRTGRRDGPRLSATENNSELSETRSEGHADATDRDSTDDNRRYTRPEGPLLWAKRGSEMAEEEAATDFERSSPDSDSDSAGMRKPVPSRCRTRRGVRRPSGNTTSEDDTDDYGVELLEGTSTFGWD